MRQCLPTLKLQAGASPAETLLPQAFTVQPAQPVQVMGSKAGKERTHRSRQAGKLTAGSMARCASILARLSSSSSICSAMALRCRWRSSS